MKNPPWCTNKGENKAGSGSGDGAGGGASVMREVPRRPQRYRRLCEATAAMASSPVKVYLDVHEVSIELDDSAATDMHPS
ncbi:hypothetical protein MRB53_030059 [Persea americana]|uniref:Uncharacterized protein n=1 Tax=Persea americana TaxID=3435 RepID=A0ACC2KK20_PERAE|nr:hypothetical protein MRB53_030059 [Persea americana]